ncbi:hypothetical protein [Rubellicoccus peritrichatus]|uniref:Uncharacterized protein n=1 Tax=Rubellicoccus peritrichatus TaxID=3080537 RepID=A0AAQ3L930_9BACT|nr:hypothetical protein [Puniceicoccus sp. CR14]WOO41346.1 hypothetical protein RZN69_22230 [Puniceicoccus sp. CR14]
METEEILRRSLVVGFGLAGSALGGFLGGALGTAAGGASGSLAVDMFLRSGRKWEEYRLNYAGVPVGDHVRLLFVRALRDATVSCVADYQLQKYPDRANRFQDEYASKIKALDKLRKRLRKDHDKLEKEAQKSRKALDKLGLDEIELLGCIDSGNQNQSESVSSEASAWAGQMLMSIQAALTDAPEVLEELLQFLEEKLPERIAKVFVEWLKTDNPLANKAWRTFQLWSNQIALQEIRQLGKNADQKQQELLAKLEELNRPLDELIQQSKSQHDTFLEKFRELAQWRHEPALIPIEEPETESNELTLRALEYQRQWLPWQEHSKAEKARDELTRFMDDPRGFLWWGVIGEGGVGKSRLALQLCRDFIAEGWSAGFIQRHWLEANCARPFLPSKDTLIVVDYAALRHEDLWRLMANLADCQNKATLDTSQGRVRVLLLERPNTFAFRTKRDESRAEVQQVRKWLYQRREEEDDTEVGKTLGEVGLGAEGVWLKDEESLWLEPPSTAEEQREILLDVMERLKPDTPVDIQQADDEAFWKTVDRLTAHGRLLYLQLIARIIIEDGSISLLQKEDQVDLLDRILDMEIQRRWLRVIEGNCQEHGLKGQGHEILACVLRYIGIATLCHSLPLSPPTNETEKLYWEESCGVALSGERSDVFIEAVNESINGIFHTNTELTMLEPDLLGERLLMQLVKSDQCNALLKGRSTKTTALGKKVSAILDPSKIIATALAWKEAAVIETFSRLLRDFPTDPAFGQWLVSAWAEYDENLANVAPAGLGFISSTLIFRVQNTDFNWIADKLKSILPDDPDEILLVYKQIIYISSAYASDPNALVLNQLVWLDEGKLTAGQCKQLMSILAIGSYCAASLEAWDYFKLCVGRLMRVSGIDNVMGDELIDLIFCECAVLAMSYHGCIGSIQGMEEWGECLLDTIGNHSENLIFSLLLVSAAVIAIRSHAKDTSFRKVGHWGNYLIEISNKYNDSLIAQVFFDYNHAERAALPKIFLNQRFGLFRRLRSAPGPMSIQILSSEGANIEHAMTPRYS